jgi:hypothetical protein
MLHSLLLLLLLPLQRTHVVEVVPELLEKARLGWRCQRIRAKVI